MSYFSKMYKCPNCGSNKIKGYMSNGKPVGSLFSEAFDSTDIHEFRCEECGGVFPYAELKTTPFVKAAMQPKDEMDISSAISKDKIK